MHAVTVAAVVGIAVGVAEEPSAVEVRWPGVVGVVGPVGTPPVEEPKHANDGAMWGGACGCALRRAGTVSPSGAVRAATAMSSTSAVGRSEGGPPGGEAEGGGEVGKGGAWFAKPRLRIACPHGAPLPMCDRDQRCGVGSRTGLAKWMAGPMAAMSGPQRRPHPASPSPLRGWERSRPLTYVLFLFSTRGVSAKLSACPAPTPRTRRGLDRRRSSRGWRRGAVAGGLRRRWDAVRAYGAELGLGGWGFAHAMAQARRIGARRRRPGRRQRTFDAVLANRIIAGVSKGLKLAAVLAADPALPCRPTLRRWRREAPAFDAVLKAIFADWRGRGHGLCGASPRGLRGERRVPELVRDIGLRGDPGRRVVRQPGAGRVGVARHAAALVSGGPGVRAGRGRGLRLSRGDLGLRAWIAAEQVPPGPVREMNRAVAPITREILRMRHRPGAVHRRRRLAADADRRAPGA